MNNDNDQNINSILSLNKLIHEPSRLAIMTALMNVEQADFMFIVNVTGMTKGNISSHLDKLEKGGLVNIEKSYTGKIPVTYLSLTSEGRKEIVAYWETVGSLGKQITNEK